MKIKRRFGVKSYIISEIKRMERWRLEFYLIMLEAREIDVDKNNFLILQLFNCYYSKWDKEELENGIT